MPGTITGRPEEPKPEDIKEPETQPDVEEPKEDLKEPEVVPSEELVDVKEYNENRIKEIERTVISEQKQSKFKCVRCGAQMFFDNPDVILSARPPKKKLVCKGCNHVDYMLA